jgi:hypothetical protein
MELRELPEYPTSPPRVNADSSLAMDQYAFALKGHGFSRAIKSEFAI